MPAPAQRLAPPCWALPALWLCRSCLPALPCSLLRYLPSLTCSAAHVLLPLPAIVLTSLLLHAQQQCSGSQDTPTQVQRSAAFGYKLRHWLCQETWLECRLCSEKADGVDFAWLCNSWCLLVVGPGLGAPCTATCYMVLLRRPDCAPLPYARASTSSSPRLCGAAALSSVPLPSRHNRSERLRVCRLSIWSAQAGPRAQAKVAHPVACPQVSGPGCQHSRSH